MDSAVDPPRSRNDLRILVAEDNAVNQTVMRAMLEQLGYAPELAIDGVEAVERLEAEHFDIVLMDVQMPRMDGLQATRTIRERWPDRSLRIIAVTANAMTEDRDRCLDAGMDDYLAKPVTLDRLATALRTEHAKPASPTIDITVDQTIALDTKVLDALGTAIGFSRVDDIARTYIDSGNELMKQAAEHLGKNNDEIAALAHRFKGSSNVVGASQMVSLCAELDAKARTTGLAVEDLERLATAFQSVIAALQSYLAAHR